jgi:hypothetical protein
LSPAEIAWNFKGNLGIQPGFLQEYEMIKVFLKESTQFNDFVTSGSTIPREDS